MTTDRPRVPETTGAGRMGTRVAARGPCLAAALAAAALAAAPLAAPAGRARCGARNRALLFEPQGDACGDIVTVIIVEQSSASNKSELKLTKETSNQLDGAAPASSTSSRS